MLTHKRYHSPWEPNMVALTVLKIFNWVAIVGILSHTCSKFVLIRLSVHSLASCLAILVTSALASAMAFAVAISSRFDPRNSVILWVNGMRVVQIKRHLCHRCVRVRRVEPLIWPFVGRRRSVRCLWRTIDALLCVNYGRQPTPTQVRFLILRLIKSGQY